MHDLRDDTEARIAARDSLTRQRDDWWGQAHGLRAAIIAHFEGGSDEELFRRAREVWKWPSFGNDPFDAAYPLPDPEPGAAGRPVRDHEGEYLGRA